MSYRLGLMDIYEPSFELCFSDDPFQDDLLSAMSTSTQHAWVSLIFVFFPLLILESTPCLLPSSLLMKKDASIFDMPSTESHHHHHHHHQQHHQHHHQHHHPPPLPLPPPPPPPPIEPQSQQHSPFDAIDSGGECTSLTPKLVDLNLNSGSQWAAMPYLDPDVGLIPLDLPYDGLQPWQEAAHVPQGLEIADAAEEVIDCAMPDHPCHASEMQQQRARDFWSETETISSEPMFKPIIPLTPPASEGSLLIVSPGELSSATGSPTTTIFTETSEEEATSPSVSERKKLPDIATHQCDGAAAAAAASSSSSSCSVDTAPCFLSKRKTDKLAVRRKQRRRVTPSSNDTWSEGQTSSPPFRKIDQMDPLSRQLLDEMLLNDRMPPIGKPIPYSVIMVRLRHLYCGAEETLRGHFRRLTKPKEQRVRKPVWKDNDVRLLEEAVKLYLDATTKRKISWTAVGEYIFSHGGSYKFGVTACSKKWYSLSK
ncbi:hypothetical protein L249_6536 [Ophiocordyceps polyrhachis-furcata BCC 54312]|uniref:Myb-like domain-containing protein n=1 Tax=Ophiocordyceps polyrhachis-furcata BCC 54312 TaxID=1330021 RepID=A0A367LK64_9HYPO|nr:hypothetical protein L249_6536 [Ophiocordyceps polyrhachis-furcata BCC 54312]